MARFAQQVEAADICSISSFCLSQASKTKISCNPVISRCCIGVLDPPGGYELSISATESDADVFDASSVLISDMLLWLPFHK